LESNPARNQRRVGKLGQTRAHSQRAGASVIAKPACGSVAHTLTGDRDSFVDHEISVQRALHADARLIEHVRVNHRRAHVFVS
jgi:hypothetical protein